MKDVGTKKDVSIMFSDVCLPDPKRIQNQYAEECFTDWHIELRANNNWLLSYAVMLNNENEFEEYALWLSNESDYQIIKTFDEVKDKIEKYF